MARFLYQVENPSALTADQTAFRGRYTGQGHTFDTIAPGQTPPAPLAEYAIVVNHSGDAPPDVSAFTGGFLVLTADPYSGPDVTSSSAHGSVNRGSSGAPAAKFGTGVVPRDSSTQTNQQLYSTSSPINYYTESTWGAGGVPVLIAHPTYPTRWASVYYPAGSALISGAAASGPRGAFLPTTFDLFVAAAWTISDSHVNYLVVPPVANVAPTVSAGLDASVLVDTEFRRIPTGSDPDGTIVEWEWRATAFPAGATTESTFVRSTGELITNHDAVGDYVHEVRGRDELGAWSAWDACTLTVTAATELPGGPVEAVTGQHQVTGGVLRHADAATGRAIVRKVDAEASMDHEVTVTISALTASADGRTAEVGACVNMSSTDASCFNLAVDVRGRWNLYRRAADGSVAETLKADYEYVVPAAPITARLKRAGDALTGYINGVLVVEAAAVGVTGVHAGISLFRTTTGEVADVSALATAATTPAAGVAPPAPVPYLRRRGYNSFSVEAEPVVGAGRYLLSIDGVPWADTTDALFNVDGLQDNTVYTVGMAARAADGATSAYGELQVATWPYTGHECLIDDDVRAVVLEEWDPVTSTWVGGPVPGPAI